jgi:hypothetical protein
MNTIIKNFIGLCATGALVGCVSMADYNVAIANDGSFAAFDKQFAVNPLDYPVFALARDQPKQDPEVGLYKGPSEWTTDILPSDRWEITHMVHGQYLAYSETYGLRYCKRQLSGRRSFFVKDFTNKCDDGGKGQQYVDSYKYLYVNHDGFILGWQYIRNNERAPFEKTWFKLSNKGDWSGQPWFKCVDRCDRLGNMK